LLKKDIIIDVEMNDELIDLIKQGNRTQLIEYLKNNECSINKTIYKAAIDSNLDLINVIYAYHREREISIIEQLYYYKLLNLDIFYYLIKKDSNIFFHECITNEKKIKIIDYCIYTVNPNIIVLLLHYKNKKSLSNEEINNLIFDKKAMTLFTHSCYCPLINGKVMDYFIECGIDINRCNDEGKTALIQECENGDYEVAVHLIEKGADINRPDENDNYPILEASRQFNRKLFKYLIENEADLNKVDKDGNTPLIIECQNIYSSDIVGLLVNHGADVNIINQQGCTALMKACENTREKFEMYMIKNGCEINRQQHDAFSTSLISCDLMNERIIKCLVRHGANVNTIDHEGNTAALLAYNAGKINMAKYLIKKGADVHVKDKNGDIPLVNIEITNSTTSSTKTDKSCCNIL